MGIGPSRAPGRRRAIALHAEDAATLLGATLPYVLKQMTSAQFYQVQRVLDAAVVDADVEKHYKDYMNRAIIDPRPIMAVGGPVVYRDPDLVRRADRYFDRNYMRVSEADENIRLDFEKLLIPDALKSTTDNPDEARYLLAVRQTLAKRGVWLRMNPQGPKGYTFVVRYKPYLSLGYEGYYNSGEYIPTQTGRLDRKALMGTTLFGAGYWAQVIRGGVQRGIDNAVRTLQNRISTGRTLHEQEENARDSAAPGVPFVSDLLGGADYPDMKIWDEPDKLVVMAMNQNVGGNVKESSKTLALAAFEAGIATKRLNDYINATMSGAARAVKVLTVAKTVGEIAQIALVVIAAISGIARLLLAEGAADAGGAAAGETAANAKNYSPQAFYDTNLNARIAWEKTLNQAGMTLQSGEFGGAINRYDVAFRSRLTSCTNEIMEWLGTNSDASLTEKFDAMDRINLKWWGNVWGPPLD